MSENVGEGLKFIAGLASEAHEGDAEAKVHIDLIELNQRQNVAITELESQLEVAKTRAEMTSEMMEARIRRQEKVLSTLNSINTSKV